MMAHRSRPGHTQPTSLRIPGDVLVAVDEEAVRLDVTRTWLVIKILRMWMEAQLRRKA